MADTHYLSPDAHLAGSLAMLRGLAYVGAAPDGHHLVPGVFFSLDPEQKNSVEVESRPGTLLKLRLNIDKPARWLSFNMGLGAADFAECRIVGIACRMDAPTPASFRICLRSGVEGGHSDVFFAKTVVATPDTGVHLDVLQIASHPGVPVQSPWRELILFFQSESCEINLRDFRMFVI